MGIALHLALLAAFCTPAHPCHHVLHIGPSTRPSAHAAWDSKQLFAPGQVAVQINYSPRLTTDAAMNFEPMTYCGVHYWITGRFNGVAYACGDQPVPLHVQVANVTRKHLRIGITYWVPQPQFTG